MTATVTVRARAIPVTVQVGEATTTIDPWQGKDFQVDGSAQLTITEADAAPEAKELEEPAEQTATEEAMLEKEVEGKPAYRGGRRAPAADSDSTQIG